MKSSDADQRDVLLVHVGAWEDRIEDRGEDGFPVVAERDVLLIQRRLLPGAVVGSPTESVRAELVEARVNKTRSG